AGSRDPGRSAGGSPRRRHRLHGARYGSGVGADRRALHPPPRAGHRGLAHPEIRQPMSYRTPVEQDIERIRTLFLQMCVRAEAMVRQAVRSVVERDSQLGRTVVTTDRELDRLELEIDRRCLACLALRQPVGHDLRLVTTVMKMVTDLERVGDLAVNVAERGLELSAGGGLEPDQDLPRMGEMAADMIRTAADAFVSNDVRLARSLRERDQE